MYDRHTNSVNSYIKYGKDVPLTYSSMFTNWEVCRSSANHTVERCIQSTRGKVTMLRESGNYSFLLTNTKILTMMNSESEKQILVVSTIIST